MSEKLYEFLVKLYPAHFRRRYGDEALRLVRDRARSEKGFFPGLRLWLDLLLDLATSLPREYSSMPTTPVTVAQPLNGEPSFQLLDERSLNPTLLALGGMLSAFLFWTCIYAVVHSRTFPVLFRAPLSLQEPVKGTMDQVRYPHAEESPAVLGAGKGSLDQADLSQPDPARDPAQVDLAHGPAVPAYIGGSGAREKRPAFRVISIRRHTAETGPVQAGPTPDGFRSIGLPMSGIFQRAYALPNQNGLLPEDLITGAPGWLSGEPYDVVAKVDAADLADWQKPSMRQAMLRAMLQAMLAERCNAVVHYRSKETPVHDLVIDHVERPSEN